jgi:hypothetical protein
MLAFLRFWLSLEVSAQSGDMFFVERPTFSKQGCSLSVDLFLVSGPVFVDRPAFCTQSFWGKALV